MKKSVEVLRNYIVKKSWNLPCNSYKENGYNYVFNNYSFFRTKLDVGDVEEVNSSNIDCEKIIKSNTDCDYKIVELPDAKVLSEFIKSEKERIKSKKHYGGYKQVPAWDFGHDKVNIEAELLQKVMKTMENPTAIMYKYCIVISDENSTCFIMGIRKAI